MAFWAWRGKFVYHRFAVFSFWLGYLFMIASIVTGLIDSGGFDRMGEATRAHFYMSGAVFIFYTARTVYLRFANAQDRYHAMIQISGSVIGNILVVLTAYFGGKLVY